MSIKDILRVVPIAVLFCGFLGGADSGLAIISTMNVQFLVTDPSGRQTGFDPETKQAKKEIPASHYDVQSMGPWEGNEPETSSREFSTAFGTTDTLVDGEYMILVISQTGGPYSLDIDIQRGSRSDSFIVNGLMEEGVSRSYTLHYTADSSKAIVIDTLTTK